VLRIALSGRCDVPYKVSTLRKRASLLRKILLGEADINVCVSSFEDIEFLRRSGILDRVGIFKIENVDPALLSDFPDPRLRAFAAQKTEDPELLRRLAADEDESVRAAVVINKCTPSDVLERKCKDPSQVVRYWAVRLAPTLPLEAVNDSSARVRAALCSRSDCPPKILRKLADDEASVVRASVAQHPNTPVEVLVRFAESPDPVLALKIAWRPDLPEAVLNRLLKRDDMAGEIARDVLRKRKVRKST